MGLLDILVPPTQNWRGGTTPNPFVNWWDQNRNAVSSGFGGLVGANNLHDAIGGFTQGLNSPYANQADQAFIQSQQQQQKDANAARREQTVQNMTIKWLQARNPDLASALSTGSVSAADAMKQALTPAGRNNVSYSQTPIMLSDPQGGQHVGQMSNGGGILIEGQTYPSLPKGWKMSTLSQLGGDNLSPETLDLIATQFLAGDKTAIQGFARNPTMRALIANAITKKANEMGMDGNAIAAQISAYGGNVAAQRAAGTRAAQVGMAASEANQMADIALKASAAVPRSSFVPWNVAVNAYMTNTSSPEMAAFVTATTSLVNAYARAVSPLGAPTDAMRQHAEAMLNTAQSPEAYAAVIQQMKKEMEAALNAPAEVSDRLKTNITGLPPDIGSDSSAGPPPDGIDSMTWQYMTPEERALWN